MMYVKKMSVVVVVFINHDYPSSHYMNGDVTTKCKKKTIRLSGYYGLCSFLPRTRVRSWPPNCEINFSYPMFSNVNGKLKKGFLD